MDAKEQRRKRVRERYAQMSNEEKQEKQKNNVKLIRETRQKYAHRKGRNMQICRQKQR